MKRLTVNIEVGNWVFDFVTNFEVVSTWDTLTDTCVIELPRNIIFKRDGEILENIIGGENPVFFGDEQVIVRAGYDRDLKIRFMGRLMDVKPTRPLQLICEDEMYFLKQTYIDETIDLKNAKLKDLIDRLFEFGVLEFTPEEDRIVEDIDIGDITVKNTSAVKVLDWLRSKLGIVSYYRAGLSATGGYAPKFISGLAYNTDDNFGITKTVDDSGVTTFSASGLNSEKQVYFEFGQNIINDDNLEIRRDDNQKILVIGKSKQADNSVVTAEAGDRGGEVQTINFPELTQDQLDQFVQDRLSKVKYTGFSGTFEAFLEPFTSHGDVVNMTNTDTPDKNGVYLVKQVVTNFGVNGGRQVITLGQRLSDV